MRDLVSSICKGAKVIPVVVIENVEDAVPLARCLVDNGLPAVEVTLRTPAALEAIKAIVNEVKDCVVGVGSILSEEQLKAAIDAGAHFGVSPGTSATLLSALKATDWPFLPGLWHHQRNDDLARSRFSGTEDVPCKHRWRRWHAQGCCRSCG